VISKIKLYNSKTGKVEEFISIEPQKVSMYVCGPTVYNYAHIGNARPIVVFDMLRRLFEANGYKVEYISNITDVDDKIINKAIEEKVTENVITKRYLQAYLKLRDSLNTKDLDAMPKVTDTMAEIIVFIQSLLDSGHAYFVDGDVYFRVENIDDYGEFSKQNLEELKIGARVQENTLKENPLDFALWKKTDQGIMWESPFGKGRPGWHTECVVMIDNHFHNKIDIHGGGLDLRFPHHENEIAQAKAAFGHDLANYWIYNGMLNIAGEKMSKSLGNVLLAQDVTDTLGTNKTRWILLSGHYKEQLQFSDELLKQADSELGKIAQALKQAVVKLALQDYQDDLYDEASYEAFVNCLNDDLNTPNGYAVIFDTVKEINQLVRQAEVDLSLLSQKINAVTKMLDLLGVLFEKIELDAEDKEMYNQWTKAKVEKDFKKADSLRVALIEKGIL